MLGILNGQVYDPLNKIDAEEQDIWVKQGRIVAPEVVDRERAKIIDAAGLVVMPGGVDIHSHIVGAKVNAGRKPEQFARLDRYEWGGVAYEHLELDVEAYDGREIRARVYSARYVSREKAPSCRYLTILREGARLSRLENNLIIPDYNTIRALATALRITPSELCCLPNERPNQ